MISSTKTSTGEAVRFGNNSSDNKFIYVGTATIGASESDAVWKIMEINTTLATNSSVKWADGNQQYDNVWNNRESLSYS
jgi:hypothetical protein